MIARILFILSFIVYSTELMAQPASEFSWPDGKQVAVSLSFDDARASQVQGGTALLDQYGVKATFYVVPEMVRTHLDGWRAAVASGHEIGNHSVHHPCSGNFEWSRAHALESYTLKQMRAELIEANRLIEELLGVVPVTFAYPCGQTFVKNGRETQSYVPIAAELFKIARGWLDEAPNDPIHFDTAQATGMKMDEKDFNEIKPLIEQARDNGQWLILAGHEIGGGGQLSTRIDMLKALFTYAANPENGVWLAPVKDVAAYIEQSLK